MEVEEFLQYIRLKSRPRVNWMCSAAFDPPPSLLRAIFRRDIQDDELAYYKKKYRQNCKSLVNEYMDRVYTKKLLDSVLGEAKRERLDRSIVSRTVNMIHQKLIELSGRKHYLKFIWTGKDSEYGDLVEFIINIVIKAYQSAKLTWSEWFSLTTDGQQLLYFILHGRKTERLYGLGIFFIYLFSIYFFSGYDDVYFAKELFEFLPSVEPIFDRYPLLREPIINLIVNKSSGFVLMQTLNQIMRKVYNVPEELLNGFFTDEDNHIVEEIQLPSEEEKNDS